MVKAGLRNSYLLVLFLLFSYAMNKAVIMGNEIIAKVIDTMLSGQQVVFSAYMLPLLWIAAIGTAAAYFVSISGSHYSAAVQRDVRESLGAHLMKLPFSYFDQKGTGSIITRLISDISEMGRFFSEILPQLLTDIVVLAVSTGYVVRMDANLILVLFVSYPIMLIAANMLSKKLAELTRKLRTHMDTRTSLAYDAVQGIVVGRSYNLYEPQKKKIYEVIDKMVEQGCRSTRISSLSWVVKITLTNIPVIICYLFALRETMQSRITVGEMLAFTVILDRVLNPIGNIVFCLNDIRETGVSIKRIQEIFSQPEEGTGGGIRRIPASDRAVPAIEWRDVDFHYDSAKEHQVLNRMSFTIETGEQTAFAGGSGEGKTTIFKLFCGFYQRQGGQYLLFGHPFEEWSLEAARSCFSEVSQNVFLFPGTIRQNVACGKENASDEEVMEACKNANIHDFIMSLPQGYDTPVGERGVKLSGGQRQRVSIARAFLRDAPILLLDEPTASVDVESEQKIQEAIERVSAGRTVIVIAHRLSTIQNSKRIYVVSGGRIAEAGTHQELSEKQGIYAEMYGKELTVNV